MSELNKRERERVNKKKHVFLAFQNIFEFLPQARHLGCGGASVVVTGGILG